MLQTKREQVVNTALYFWVCSQLKIYAHLITSNSFAKAVRTKVAFLHFKYWANWAYLSGIDLTRPVYKPLTKPVADIHGRFRGNFNPHPLIPEWKTALFYTFSGRTFCEPLCFPKSWICHWHVGIQVHSSETFFMGTCKEFSLWQLSKLSQISTNVVLCRNCETIKKGRTFVEVACHPVVNNAQTQIKGMSRFLMKNKTNCSTCSNPRFSFEVLETKPLTIYQIKANDMTHNILRLLYKNHLIMILANFKNTIANHSCGTTKHINKKHWSLWRKEIYFVLVFFTWKAHSLLVILVSTYIHFCIMIWFMHYAL